MLLVKKGGVDMNLPPSPKRDLVAVEENFLVVMSEKARLVGRDGRVLLSFYLLQILMAFCSGVFGGQGRKP